MLLYFMNKRILSCMVHAYADWNTDESKVTHRFESMLDLDFDLHFNERWSAWLEIEAMGMAMNGMEGMEGMEGMDMGDGSTMDPVNPAVIFNGAYIQYTRSERTFFRIGDLNFYEGLFKNYYDFGDPRDDAAGISQKTIRGLEFQWNGLQFDILAMTKVAFTTLCLASTWEWIVRMATRMRFTPPTTLKLPSKFSILILPIKATSARTITNFTRA